MKIFGHHNMVLYVYAHVSVVNKNDENITVTLSNKIVSTFGRGCLFVQVNICRI